ncbi:U6 snRNA-associated Sm-like protein LSm7 [Balamuthia mandrillaris]
MKSKKESILDLENFLNQKVTVKFTGGREVQGVLKGHDNILNIVLDETIEFLRDPLDPYKPTTQTRKLGLVVCKGTAIMLICPVEGTVEISNPFAKETEEQRI